jgi:hypothetical protein
MLPVATTSSSFEARVIAARLGAEGIVWELRGDDGVYPVGRVEVLVGQDDVDVARELLAVEGEALDGEDDEPEDVDGDERVPVGLLLVLAAVLLAGISTFVRAVAGAT